MSRSRSKSKRSISYARSACVDPNSIAAQHAANRSAAEAAGDSVIEEVSDDGFSGSSLVRPGLTSILVRAVRGELVGCRLYAKDKMRVARSAEPMLYSALKEVLGALGVELVSISGAEVAGEDRLFQELTTALEGVRRGRRIQEGLARRKARLAAPKASE